MGAYGARGAGEAESAQGLGGCTTLAGWGWGSCARGETLAHEASAQKQVYGQEFGSAWACRLLDVGVGMSLGALGAGNLPRTWLWCSAFMENSVCACRCI